jgi:hypothetical protein
MDDSEMLSFFLDGGAASIFLATFTPTSEFVPFQPRPVKLSLESAVLRAMFCDKFRPYPTLSKLLPIYAWPPY